MEICLFTFSGIYLFWEIDGIELYLLFVGVSTITSLVDFLGNLHIPWLIETDNKYLKNSKEHDLLYE